MEFSIYLFIPILILVLMFLHMTLHDEKLMKDFEKCCIDHDKYMISVDYGDVYCKKCKILWTHDDEHLFIYEDYIVHKFELASKMDLGSLYEVKQIPHKG